MQFAQRAAPFFESVEIIELHHPDKVDAPSGTARQTAAMISEARRALPPAPDATGADDLSARGEQIAGIPVSRRCGCAVWYYQEVLFGSPGETLLFGTTPSIANRSCPGCSWRCVRWGAAGTDGGIDELLVAP